MAISSKQLAKYGICSANTVDELAGFVNYQIKEGWELHGSVFQGDHHGQLFYHQAMVAYKDSPALKKVISNDPYSKKNN